MKTLAYFITSHGFGHGVRSTVVINALPKNWAVVIYTSLPLGFLQEEITRPFKVVSCTIDCGCLQKDSVSVEIEETLKRYEEINAQRKELIQKYSQSLTEEGVDQVFADIPPLAFPIAKKVGLRVYGISNFNWVDIYEPFINNYPLFLPCLEQMKKDYQQADGHLLLYPGVKSFQWLKEEEVGIVSREGTSQRASLAQKYGLDKNKKWCLIYLGNFGLPHIKWERLDDYEDWEFLGLYPLENAPGNYHLIEKDSELKYADLTASCQVVLGKLGYGLVGECFRLGVPILFFERSGFVEYFELEGEILKREQGVLITLERLKRVDFLVELEFLAKKKFQRDKKTALKAILALLSN